MLKRVISSVVGLPILIWVIYLGGVVLQCAIFLLAVIGMYELFHAVSKKNLPVHAAGYLCAGLYVMILPHFSGFMAISLFSAFIITLLIILVIRYEHINIMDVSVTLLGFFYVAFLMSFIYLVRNYSYGIYFVWIIFISCWGCDTFAYFTGKTLGKHKLYESLSPKKTVEGAIGGVLGATALGFVYAVVLKTMHPAIHMNIVLWFTVICFVCSIFSQLGDLAASAIKRYTNIKDYGSIIPGHGGVLDRFDSLLFTAPGVYFVMALIIRFTR